MKKIIFASAILAAFSSSAFAQQTAPAPDAAPPAAAPTPEYTFTGNLAVVSDYRFRGISQTFKYPAVQGGFDYAHKSGFYVGNWNSNVSGVEYPDGASLEMDFYGGYKFDIVKDLTGDVGLYTYYYPGAKVTGTNENFNNAEIYFAGTYKWFSAKYSYGITDYFGLNSTTASTFSFNSLPNRGGSKGSGYLDLNANFEVADKTTANLHIGHQTVHNYGELSYTDYKAGVSRDFGFATVGLALIGTNADTNFWQAKNSGGSTKELGNTTVVLSFGKTF